MSSGFLFLLVGVAVVAANTTVHNLLDGIQAEFSSKADKVKLVYLCVEFETTELYRKIELQERGW